MPCDAQGDTFVWIGQFLIAMGFGFGLGATALFAHWMRSDGYDMRKVRQIARDRRRAVAHWRRVSGQAQRDVSEADEPIEATESAQ